MPSELDILRSLVRQLVEAGALICYPDGIVIVCGAGGAYNWPVEVGEAEAALLDTFSEGGDDA